MTALSEMVIDRRNKISVGEAGKEMTVSKERGSIP